MFFSDKNMNEEKICLNKKNAETIGILLNKEIKNLTEVINELYNQNIEIE